MDRRLPPCLPALLLLAAPAPAPAADLTGIWFAEYRSGPAAVVQEVSQRFEGGRWRAEVWVWEACRQTQRFLLDGRWQAADGTLTHIVQRRGNYFLSPVALAYDIQAMDGDRLRLREGGDGPAIEARRVTHGFRPAPPACDTAPGRPS